MNQRLYRNLANQAEIKKYTDRNKIYQITDEEIISKKINDEQGIIKKEFMMKQQEYKFKKDKYQDADFKATDQPLGYKENSNKFQWLRLHQITQQKDLFPSQPQNFKDELNTNYQELDNLFQLYNIVSRASYLAKRLFEHQKVNNLGIYGVWIFKNGKWKCIILDDYVLVKIDENAPCLYYPSKSVIKENLWLLILEKALAKAYKGYQNLKINELYNSLVELTGSPYLLIRKKYKNQIQYQNKEEQVEKEEKDFLWQKICSGIKKGYIIHAQCLDTYRGIQKENIYFVEFFYEFSQQFDVSKKILQMKNYRTNQNVLDVQFNFTAQEMDILNNNKDNGVFFVTFDEFYQNFDNIAIQRIELRDSHNSLKLTQDNDQDISFFTLKLNNFEDTSGYISVCQKDVQYFQNQGYSYSPFSLILAEIKPFGEIQYYSQTFSNDKMIHLPYNWKEGIYIIHIEVRWTQKIYRKFRISVSSNQDVGLQKYNYAQQKLNGELILSLIAKNYIEKLGNEIKFESFMPKTKKGQMGVFYIYYFKNVSPDFCSVKAQIESRENQEFIDPTILDKNKIAFWLFPNEEFILLLRITSALNKNSSKFTFQNTNTSVPQNEPSYKKTLQSQLKQINIYNEFDSLTDRKQNLLIDYFQQPVTMEESEKSIEQVVVVQKQKKVIKKQYPFDYNSSFYKYTRFCTALLNYIIILLIIFGSLFRNLQYDVIVYAIILMQMNSFRIKETDLRFLVILCTLTVVYDAMYIQLFSSKEFSLFSKFLLHNSVYQVILKISQVFWILLIIFKLIFLFLMVRIYVQREEELNLYFQSYQEVQNLLAFQRLSHDTQVQSLEQQII
ncbi:hypothetical protein ABPG74_004396 [Tetrahymena malaccensis]